MFIDIKQADIYIFYNAVNKIQNITTINKHINRLYFILLTYILSAVTTFLILFNICMHTHTYCLYF